MRTRSAPWPLALALLCSAAVGGGASCTGGSAARPEIGQYDGGTSPQSGGDGCGGPATLDGVETNVFAKSCSFGSCHGGATPAAGLDLSTAARACKGLVNQRSCMFSGKMRVFPGNPDQSYLFHKVAGDDLGTSPDGTCAGLANGMPQRMPLGGAPLCQGAIDQVKAWIAAGASCGAPPVDAGAGDGASPLDGGGDGGPPNTDIAQLVPAGLTINAGDKVNVSVTLAQPALSPGVTVVLATSDPTAIALPSAAYVPTGETSAIFEAQGLRPAHATIQASAGGKGASFDELVLGLYVAEIFYIADTGTSTRQWVRLYNATSVAIDLTQYTLGAGKNGYTETTVPLSGNLAPAGCFVVGGPMSDSVNSDPIYSEVKKFSPPIPQGGSHGAGVALFGVPQASLNASTLPIDSVVFGSGNGGNLVARDGSVATPVGFDVYVDDSLLRSGLSWIDQYPPYPNSCP